MDLPYQTRSSWLSGNLYHLAQENRAGRIDPEFDKYFKGLEKEKIWLRIGHFCSELCQFKGGLTMTRFWIFCIFTMFATACSVPSSPQPEAWPQKQARISLQESDYLDLGLRVLALEMTQSAGGQRQYYLQYLPRMGHIEATVRFEQNAKAAFSAENRSFWQQRIETETQAIHIGVKELIEGLALAKGFDPKRHIWIRFQTQGENLEEIALMNPKGIQWLQMSLPE